jgi:S1-C subfamily serine protease
MKKLAYIFGIVLVISGCGGGNHIVKVSYDPIDPPNRFLKPEAPRPILYIDSVVDNREFAVEHKQEVGLWGDKSGRFEEDPKLIYSLFGIVQGNYRTSKTPTEIIREALETEVHRLGIKITKDRDLADGILNASIEKFSYPNSSEGHVARINAIVIVKINLRLYQPGFDNPVWSGTVQGRPKFKRWDEILNSRRSAYGLKTALNMAIKQWHSYPGFQEAMVRLSGNDSSQATLQPIAPQSSIKQPVVSGGTGFLFSSKDYVITNYHVVKGASSILAKFTNGRTVEASVVAKDPKNDIAILKLAKAPPLSATPIKLGDSSQARMGEKIFTIGYPASKIMGEKPKYSEGVINSMTGLKDDPAFFQVSVPVQPGNSGGPLFNKRGEVIGITTASLSLLAIEAIGAIPQNVNYAIKSSFVKNLLSTIPELMLSNTGIVVVPDEPENSLPNFIEQASKNIVLIEAKQ